MNKSRGYAESEVRLSKKIMTYWANFAKTGNPSLSEDLTWTDTYWPLHTPFQREVLHLDAKDEGVMEGLRVKQCAFWRKFLPQLELPQPKPATQTPELQTCRTSSAVTAAS